MSAPDPRIQSLTAEINRLRTSHHQADNHLHALLLKITEVQLNLANQDRTLNKLDESINGNGKPGLLMRVDRTERLAATLIKSVWLLSAAAVTAFVKLIADHFK